MCVQALYYLQACVITVLVGLIVRYLQHSIFCVYIYLSGAPSAAQHLKKHITTLGN